ncbi:hypothetical protein ZOSMA_259G00230 [Zostera marina]|uniref:DUF4408 domain-containing protein n=1 Tax=Zostera marina TaxID=29655 RepID=A0A0K9PFE9_ZOSMR|nr:hypothetical protein ZOSMA_259G00230 [Zostera marina]
MKLALLRFVFLKIKIALLSLSVSSATFITITLPSTWTAVRVYLSPPYVFFAVNCIIVVIWFLSKQTNYKLQQHSDTTGKSKKLPDDQTPIISQIQFQYSIPKSSKTQSQSSCLPSAAAVTILEGDIMRKSRGPSTGYFNPTPTSGREDEMIDGFDATWKSIMAKKKNDATWNVLPEVEELRSSLTITRNPMGFGNDTRREPLELKTDEEIEAFIKKTKDQIRLKKKLQSYQRRRQVDMVSYGVGGER